MRNLEDPEKRKECTDKSIEARKDGKAAKKQAVTRSLQGMFLETNSRRIYQNKHIKEDILDLEAAALFDKDIFGKDERWIETFIYNYLKEAKENPDSRAAERLASILFSDSALNDIHEYIERQNAKDVDYFNYLLRTTLYDRQQEVFDDQIYKKHIIINSRRSGKTELMGRLLVSNLLKPDAHCVYINRNSSAAIRQIRGPLQTSLNKINLRVIKGSVEAQEMHFENGSQLLILGNNNSADIDKLRGERISCCILDECGHQRNIRQLLRETIDPALKDYGKEARMYIVGTPPRIPHTYIEDIWMNNKTWKKWHWTFEENPFIPDRENVIKEVCEENGCTPDSAFIQREYYGRMDAYDDDAKWIKKYSVIENQELPKNVSHAFVGVDWGYEDRAAVVSVIADEVTKRAYVVDCWSEAKKGITEISNEIKRQVESLKEKYHPNRRVVVICDNNEKGAVVDLVKVYKIPNVYTAYKYDKDMALDQLNDFLGGNRIVFLKDHSNACIEDANSTVWQRDEETDRILHELDDDVWHPNALMALLYVSRQFAYDVCRYIDRNKQARNILAGRDRDEDLEEIFIDSNI